MYHRIEHKTYPEKLFPVGLIFIIDIFITVISFTFSYLICSQFFPGIIGHKLVIQLPIIIAITSFVFLFIGIYKGLVHYSQLRQVYSIFNAICLANILTIVLAVVNGKLIMEADLSIPLSIILVHSALSFLALVFSRYLYKRILDFSKFKSYSIQNVVLISDNEDNDTKEVVKYLEDNSLQVVGNQIFTIGKVSTELNKTILNENFVEKIIVNIKTYSVDKLLQILDQIAQFNLPIYLVQSEFEKSKVRNEKVSTSFNLKRLDLTHLFPNQLNLNVESTIVKNNLNNRTVLVTGAGGSIAVATLKNLLKIGVKFRLILLDISEASLNSIVTFCKNYEYVETISKLGDVKNNKLLKKVFKEYKPDFVLHCAGNNKPELIDNHIGNIFKENILVTKQLADLASESKVKRFIFCSTVDAERPKTTLEVSKRISELYLNGLNQHLGKNIFFSIRLNNIFDSNSSLINYLAFQIAMGKSIEPKNFEGHKVFANKNDIAKTISYFLGTSIISGSIISLKLGTRIKTAILVQFLKSLKDQRTISDSMNESLIEEQSFLRPKNQVSNNNLLNQPPYEVVETATLLSYQKIMQLVDSLCFNIAMNEEKFPEVFELLTDFESGEWADEFNRYRLNTDENSKGVINLN